MVRRPSVPTRTQPIDRIRFFNRHYVPMMGLLGQRHLGSVPAFPIPEQELQSSKPQWPGPPSTVHGASIITNNSLHAAIHIYKSHDFRCFDLPKPEFGYVRGDYALEKFPES